MIRNIVLGRLRTTDNAQIAEEDHRQVEDGLAGILGLHLPGLLANHAGWDAKLRDGGWDFAITNDWQDASSYRNYDTDAEHNVYRQQIGSACDEIARVQLTISST